MLDSLGSWIVWPSFSSFPVESRIVAFLRSFVDWYCMSALSSNVIGVPLAVSVAAILSRFSFSSFASFRLKSICAPSLFDWAYTYRFGGEKFKWLAFASLNGVLNKSMSVLVRWWVLRGLNFEPVPFALWPFARVLLSSETIAGLISIVFFSPR